MIVYCDNIYVAKGGKWYGMNLSEIACMCGKGGGMNPGNGGEDPLDPPMTPGPPEPPGDPYIPPPDIPTADPDTPPPYIILPDGPTGDPTGDPPTADPNGPTADPPYIGDPPTGDPNDLSNKTSDEEFIDPNTGEYVRGGVDSDNLPPVGGTGNPEYIGEIPPAKPPASTVTTSWPYYWENEVRVMQSQVGGAPRQVAKFTEISETGYTPINQDRAAGEDIAPVYLYSNSKSGKFIVTNSIILRGETAVRHHYLFSMYNLTSLTDTNENNNWIIVYVFDLQGNGYVTRGGKFSHFVAYKTYPGNVISLPPGNANQIIKLKAMKGGPTRSFVYHTRLKPIEDKLASLGLSDSTPAPPTPPPPPPPPPTYYWQNKVSVYKARLGGAPDKVATFTEIYATEYSPTDQNRGGGEYIAPVFLYSGSADGVFTIKNDISLQGNTAAKGHYLFGMYYITSLTDTSENDKIVIYKFDSYNQAQPTYSGNYSGLLGYKSVPGNVISLPRWDVDRLVKMKISVGSFNYVYSTYLKSIDDKLDGLGLIPKVTPPTNNTDQGTGDPGAGDSNGGDPDGGTGNPGSGSGGTGGSGDSGTTTPTPIPDWVNPQPPTPSDQTPTPSGQTPTPSGQTPTPILQPTPPPTQGPTNNPTTPAPGY